MPIKTIAVLLGNNIQRSAHILYAAQMAQAHDAFLIGVLVMPSGRASSPASSFSLGHAANSAVIRQQRDRQLVAVEEARSLFEATVRNTGLDHEFRSVRMDASEREIHLPLLHADLVVAGMPSGNGESEPAPDIAQLATGVPFLLVPDSWRRAAPPENILIGWNASREARRAVNDALPIVIRAQSTTVAIVDPEDSLPSKDDSGMAELAVYLLRHGVKLIGQPLHSLGESVADTLLRQAQENDHDLIVIGAYSHNRTVERLFGGVTRALLKRSTAPLFISH